MPQVIIRRRLVPRSAPTPADDVDLVPPSKVMRAETEIAVRKLLKREVEEPKKEPIPELPPESSTAVKLQPINGTAVKDILMSIMSALGDGKAIMILRLSEDRWQINPIADIKSPMAMQKKLSGRAYWDEVLDPKYIEWDKEWQGLTQSEKVQRCKKAGVVWEEDKDIRINNLHMTEAYRAKLGIEKYKEEYMDRASRAAVRG